MIIKVGSTAGIGIGIICFIPNFSTDRLYGRGQLNFWLCGEASRIILCTCLLPVDIQVAEVVLDADKIKQQGRSSSGSRISISFLSA